MNMSDPVDVVPEEAVKLVGQFVKRGRELQDVQPLISYYCYLYAAQLILESKLHMETEGVALYIETLLNKIEENRKAIEENAPKLAGILSDKEKSFKLVLSFSLSIFNRAFKDIEIHTASKGTVVSFMAFLNFIQVLNLWPEFYSLHADDLQRQIKYAKFHSNRILKAIKSNMDPNDYITPDDEEELLNLMQSTEGDDHVKHSEDEKEDAETTQIEEKGNVDTNAFTSLPEAPKDIQGEITMPSAPVLIKGLKNSLGLPSTPEFSDVSTTRETVPAENAKPPTLPVKPGKATKTPAPSTITHAPIVESKILSKEDVEKIWSKSEIISNAQRKAKFAISALNYEDIETAIKELQDALKLLRGE